MVLARESRPQNPPGSYPRPVGRGRHASSRSRTARTLSAGFVGYLLLSVLIWWNVWSSHPTTVTSCGCGDASLFIWYIEWPAYAVLHGHNLLYSSALFHPTGTNLLSNTSVLLLGVPLIPVTLLFGPVASFNVASTLGPALTALGMLWLLRRWVRWTPAAFAGGLIYGFSPFAFVNLAGGHLMLAVLGLLPLMLGCLDTLLVRQDGNPYKVGAALGVCFVAQFFLGTEVLAIAAMSIVVGLALLVAYGVLTRERVLARRAPDALRGLATAAGLSTLALVYPFWFAVAGPGHLSGRVWPTLPPGSGASSLGNLWNLHFQVPLARAMQVFGGYMGPPLPAPEYIGAGALVILGAGLALWSRDRRLWFFGSLGILTVILSLGLAVPWHVLEQLPLLENVVPGRFAAVVTLCVAVLVALIVDLAHGSVRARLQGIHDRWGAGDAAVVSTIGARVAALAVACVALIPMASAVATNVPLTTRSVLLPQWFARAAPRLPPRQVVLAYPAPFTLVQSAMTWQAVDSMHFAMAGGGGPGGVSSRAGKERPGFDVLQPLSFSFTGSPPATPANIVAVRRALAGWRVTVVVVPQPARLPSFDRGTDAAGALGFFTAAIGRRPSYQAGAWVWSNVERPAPRRSLSTRAFARCTSVPLDDLPHESVPNCIVAASRSTSEPGAPRQGSA